MGDLLAVGALGVLVMTHEHAGLSLAVAAPAEFLGPELRAALRRAAFQPTGPGGSRTLRFTCHFGTWVAATALWLCTGITVVGGSALVVAARIHLFEVHMRVSSCASLRTWPSVRRHTQRR
jgi:hypothetical protein